MKRTALQEYRGWWIDRLSLSLAGISVDLSRRFALPGEDLESQVNKFRVKIFFTDVANIALCDLSCSAQISDVEQQNGTPGRMVYRLTCADGSYIEITAAKFVEVPF